ncbi:Complex 1 LYR protein [Dioscorea alata]|uniref:Complex 1 LYR protein n=4 Tax=Dioscorea alata TaxID=55571 RepID=A0ACB7URL9_DIOAL|nr:Complex 1 LYR protein [Dioscorea alata]KAH7663309.1 Complex 1 LYR protein [Dioscorea alata]KAH7663310.1 Complex 1 LYR protein [Dioscorea alata]KAH7663311.1 Complex 1 LYR protein [Dioscorea alata]
MVGSLELHAFITRSRVLKLYRQALRIARRAPSQSRDELRQMMRQEVEKNRHCNDKQKIRFLISDGLQRIKDLDEMLDMQGHS